MQLPKNFISLQHMCLSKIAITLHNDPDVQHFINNHEVHACIWSSEMVKSFIQKPYRTKYQKRADLLEFSRNDCLEFTTKHFPYNEYLTDEGEFISLPNEQWEILVNEKMASLPLSKVILKELKTLLRLIVIESCNWYSNHSEVVDTSIRNMAWLHNYFHWTQGGKINREKTAKALIANSTIDIKTRFLLACHYCFEDDVISLWRKLDNYPEFVYPNYYVTPLFNIEQIWINWVNDGSVIDWESIARNSKSRLVGLRKYFPKLTKEKRLKLLLTNLKERWIDYNELQFCLSHLDQHQQNEVLRQCPLQILEIYFDWPIQSELLNVLDLLWPYISVQQFRDFFDIILHQKLVFDDADLNCIFLIKKLWQKSPSEYREFVKKDKLYDIINLVLEYSGLHPFPHPLLMNNIENYLMFHAAGTLYSLSKHMFYGDPWDFKTRHYPGNFYFRRIRTICIKDE